MTLLPWHFGDLPRRNMTFAAEKAAQARSQGSTLACLLPVLEVDAGFDELEDCFPFKCKVIGKGLPDEQQPALSFTKVQHEPPRLLTKIRLTRYDTVKRRNDSGLTGTCFAPGIKTPASPPGSFVAHQAFPVLLDGLPDLPLVSLEILESDRVVVQVDPR